MEPPVRNRHAAARTTVASLSFKTVNSTASGAEFTVSEPFRESLHGYYYIPIDMLPALENDEATVARLTFAP